MASKLGFTQLKGQIEKLRKDSLEVVANANKIVYGGVHKLADRELKALNEYYKSAVASIKAARGNKIKDTAQTQIDLLHKTVNQVISHARESVGVVAEARAELAKLIDKSAKGIGIPDSNIRRAVAPAKSALEKAKAGAKSAAKQAEKTVAAAKKEASKGAKKVEKKVKAEVKTAEKKVKAVEKKVQQAKTKVVAEAKAGVEAAKKAVAPSPGSRAARATSAAKKAVTGAVETATAAVNQAVTAVTDAVKPQG
jgi:hypothetical protein